MSEGTMKATAKNALSLDWAEEVHPNLWQGEWPEGVLEHVAADLILAVSELRTEVGLPIIPSPLQGGHVRFSPRSPGHFNGDCHSVDKENPLSTAGDFFCTWEAAWRYLAAAEKHPKIKGIGVYTDMVFRTSTEGDYAMLHFDLRDTPHPYSFLQWVGWRENRKAPMQYVYKQFDPVTYHHILSIRAKNKTVI